MTSSPVKSGDSLVALKLECDEIVKGCTSSGLPLDNTSSRFQSILDSILVESSSASSESTVECLKVLIRETIVNENVPLTYSRPLLTTLTNVLAQRFWRCQTDNGPISREVCSFILDVTSSRSLSFIEQIIEVRQHLADVYEAEEEFEEAAGILVAISHLEVGSGSGSSQHVGNTENNAENADTSIAMLDEETNMVINKEDGKSESITESINDYHSSEYCKLEVYLRIARLYLAAHSTPKKDEKDHQSNDGREDEDKCVSEADSYINRASLIMASSNASNAKTDSMKALFKILQARVLDHKLKFMEAAMRYYEIVSTPSSSVNASRSSTTTGGIGGVLSESEKMVVMKSAVLCSILSPAGHHNTSKMISTLHKDYNKYGWSQKLPELYEMLVKIDSNEIISREECVLNIRPSLQPHQLENSKAMSGEEMSILDEAILQHNIISISNMFKNVSIQTLAKLLDIHVSKAEKMTGKMISEGRLHAVIDQIESFIHFKNERGGGAVSNTATSTEGEGQDRSNSSSSTNASKSKHMDIEALCFKVNEIVEMIEEVDPAWFNSVRHQFSATI